MKSMEFFLEDERQTVAFGASVAKCASVPLIINLSGELGAGKTTFVRGFLHGLGFCGKVKSPTYTVVEPYQINQYKVYHFDLYRIHDKEELELIGIRDYFSGDAIILLEWPENAGGILPQADLSCYIVALQSGRNIKLEAATPKSKIILRNLVWNE